MSRLDKTLTSSKKDNNGLTFGVGRWTYVTGDDGAVMILLGIIKSVTYDIKWKRFEK